MKGYIKIHRELCNHSIWLMEKFTRGQAWVDLILLANAQEGFIEKRGIPIDLKRGQVGWAMESLSERWQWSRDKVRRFLKFLEKKDMIGLKITKVSCTITIKNYNHWQSNEWQVKRITTPSENNKTNGDSYNEQQIDNKPTSNRHQNNNKQYTNNKEKEDKEDNKKKRGVGTLTNKDLKKLQYKYPTVIVKDSYKIFTNYYNSRGKEFEDELPAFENWLIRDKENKAHYKTPIMYYENICPKCGDNSLIEITDDVLFVMLCDICGSKKTPKRLSEIETEKYIQSRKSRMSETNKGA